MGAAAALGPTVRGVELDSLISQVKDLLPDLGEGFILACLEHYGYDSEQVINNILEERLAPALSQLDRSLDRWERHDIRAASGPGQGLLAPLLPILPSLLPQDSDCSLFPRVMFPNHLNQACPTRGPPATCGPG